MFYTKYM